MRGREAEREEKVDTRGWGEREKGEGKERIGREGRGRRKWECSMGTNKHTNGKVPWKNTNKTAMIVISYKRARSNFTVIKIIPYYSLDLPVRVSINMERSHKNKQNQQPGINQARISKSFHVAKASNGGAKNN